MKDKKESVIQKEIIDYLRKQGYYVVKTVRSNMTGVPDLLVCAKGKFYGIEVKRPSKNHEATPLQELNINDIREAGGEAFVADCLDDILLRGL